MPSLLTVVSVLSVSPRIPPFALEPDPVTHPSPEELCRLCTPAVYPTNRPAGPCCQMHAGHTLILTKCPLCEYFRMNQSLVNLKGFAYSEGNQVAKLPQNSETTPCLLEC